MTSWQKYGRRTTKDTDLTLCLQGIGKRAEEFWIDTVNAYSSNVLRASFYSRLAYVRYDTCLFRGRLHSNGGMTRCRQKAAV